MQSIRLVDFRIQPDDPNVALELKETALRSLMASVGILGLILYFISNFSIFWEAVPRLSVVLILLTITTVVGIRQIQHSIKNAGWIWTVGITITFLTALLLFPTSQTATLIAFFPLLVLMSSFHLAWCLASCVLVIPFLLFLRHIPWFSFLDLQDVACIGLLSIFGVGITLGFARSMVHVAEWAITHYRKAREEVEQLRGERVHWVQMKEDYELITREMSRLTARLEAMTQVAEEARRAKEEFVAIVSHELRTPLNMILGFSEVIMKSPQSYGDSIPQALLADIAAIERNSQHLSKLVDDVLDLSQMESGRMSLNKEWVDIHTIVDQAFSVVRFLFDSKKLYLKYEWSDSIPPVYCDSTRIRQVLINLLSNAGRFTDQGGVIVSSKVRENHLVISVSDTGPGIPKEHQERIFEPFFQAHSYLHGHKGGSGLGLSICKQFIEMHQGKMWLQSQTGEGTTFYFEIPLNPTLPPETADQTRRWFNPYSQYEPRTRPSRAGLEKPKARYVILEENGILQKYLQKYMQDAEIVSVKSLEEAIEEIKHSPADALIQNLPTPYSTSNEQWLAKIPYGTPVITCWLPGKGDTVQKMGVVDYLVKPIRRADLIFAVKTTISNPKGTILLVDDEPEILQLYSRILNTEMPSLHIVQARDGQRALYIMKERKPDLVLLDLLMPGKDGMDVLMEKMQDAQLKTIPIIVVSSRNPSGEAVLNNRITVFRDAGFSIRDLARLITQTSQVLTPSQKSAVLKPVRKPRE